MAENLISIKEVVDELYIHPLLRNIPFDTIVRYSVDFMKLMGVPKMFENRIATLEVSNYRAALPCDFYKMVRVRHKVTGEEETVYRSATDSFHLSPNREGPYEHTYKIQGNVIYTSTENKSIEISYLGMCIDDDGYPLMPSNTSYVRALKAYIKKEWFTILFDEGKIGGDVLNLALQNYAWAAGDCESEFQRMTLDDAESFYNMWSQLLLKSNDHNKHFEGTGRRESIKIS